MVLTKKEILYLCFWFGTANHATHRPSVELGHFLLQELGIVQIVVVTTFFQ